MINKMLLTVAAVGISILAAQPGHGPRGPRGEGTGTPPTAEQMIENRVARLTTLLTLTPSQVTTIKALYTAEQTATTALRTAMEAAHTALREAVNTNAPEPTIDRAAAQVGTVQGQIAAVHAKTQAKFLAALTAEQRQKLDTLGDGGRGMGGPGGMGGGFRGSRF